MSKHIVIDARIRRASTGRPVDRLLQYLQELDSDNRYTILLQQDDPWQPSAPNFTTKHIPWPIFSFNPLQQITYTWLLYRLKPDLVHFTLTPQQPIFYLGKQITMTHDLTMLRFVRAGKLPEWLHQVRMVGYRFLFWASHSLADKIIVPTEFVKNDLIKLQPFTRSKIAVTLEASEPPIQAKAQKPAKISQPYILYVGSAFPHKNLPVLLKTMEYLGSSHSEVNLVLVGKKEFFYTELEVLADQSAVRSKIHFTGFVSDEELKWLYENAKAYVFPSLSEGFGLPGLEAMAHNLPVASSDATCLPEVYKDAALYFDATKPEEIAATLSTILSDNVVADELRVKGQKVLKQYSWKKMSQETLDIYNSL